MRIVVHTAVMLLLGSLGLLQAEERPPQLLQGYSVSLPSLAQTRTRVQEGDVSLREAMTRLRDEADAALKTGPFSVIDKPRTPPSGDKHDYLSQAPYFWPDRTKKDGLPYVRRDGQINPESVDGTDRPALNAMASSVQTLALAYYLTGEERYAEHAARLVRVWFLDPATRMNPHLKYGQGIPGQTEGRGLGIIETRVLIDVVEAVGLLESSAHWKAEDQQGIVQWCAAYLDWLRTSELGRQEEAAQNNHGTWYDAQIVALAVFVGQKDLARQVLEGCKDRRIGTQLEPDGRQPHELARTRSFFYSLVNLRALFVLAHYGQPLGVDLWHYRTADGRSVRGALDYLAAYAAPDRKWPYPELQMDRAELIPFLQQATVVYRDDRYQKLMECVGDHAGSASRGRLFYGL
jgi:hypothetical protein